MYNIYQVPEQSITVQINGKSCNAGITLQSNKEVQMPIHCVVARPRAIIDIHTYIHIRVYNGWAMSKRIQIKYLTIKRTFDLIEVLRAGKWQCR